MIKRIQVTFTEKQWIILSQLRGELGATDAEIVRNIIINWLSEKSILTNTIKKRLFENDGKRKNQ